MVDSADSIWGGGVIHWGWKRGWGNGVLENTQRLKKLNLDDSVFRTFTSYPNVFMESLSIFEEFFHGSCSKIVTNLYTTSCDMKSHQHVLKF